jgi:RNA polymerase sigma factor (sigma-70 family)
MPTISRAFRRTDTPSPHIAWSDERLVSACLQGNEDAWATLIDKYKNLIFSIPLKYGAGQEDAADVFQAVCLELFSELPNLRNSGALRSWLITVATHKSFHWKQKHRRRSEKEVTDMAAEELGETIPVPPELIVEAERDQAVREAVAQLPARCAEMVRLLFYEQPPIPYRELAQRLGLALGSIGFIRGRCLGRLQKLLEDRGF